LLNARLVDASCFEIPVGACAGERQERVVLLFNVLREGERLSGLRRTLTALLVLATLLLVLALTVDCGRAVRGLIAALAASSLAGVVRLHWLERRNHFVVRELVAAVGALGF
jgi:hypothetical protein